MLQKQQKDTDKRFQKLESSLKRKSTEDVNPKVKRSCVSKTNEKVKSIATCEISDDDDEEEVDDDEADDGSCPSFLLSVMSKYMCLSIRKFIETFLIIRLP